MDREYYEQFYANKFSNLQEMDKFLEKYKLPQLILEELKEEITPILHILFQKTEEEEIPPNSFHEASVLYVIPKPDKYPS